jgi:hypothetical protein
VIEEKASQIAQGLNLTAKTQSSNLMNLEALVG